MKIETVLTVAALAVAVYAAVQIARGLRAAPAAPRTYYVDGSPVGGVAESIDMGV